MTLKFLISAEVDEEQLHKILSLINTEVSVRIAGIDLNKPVGKSATRVTSAPPADLRDRVLDAIPENKPIHRGKIHQMFSKVATTTLDGHIARLMKKGVIERAGKPGNYQRISQQILGELPGDGAAAP